MKRPKTVKRAGPYMVASQADGTLLVTPRWPKLAVELRTGSGIDRAANRDCTGGEPMSDEPRELDHQVAEREMGMRP